MIFTQMDLLNSQSLNLESTNEFEHMDPKQNEEQGFKCGEAFYFSNSGAIHVRCTICGVCFDYGNEKYMKHIITDHFNLTTYSRETDKYQISTTSEKYIKEGNKVDFDEDNKLPKIKSNLNKNCFTNKSEECFELLEEKTTLTDKINKSNSLNNNFFKKRRKTVHKCTECSQEFHKKADLVFHKKEHTNCLKTIKEGLVCEQCGRKFVHKNTLESHYEIAHNPNRRLFPCNDCEKSFTSLDSLMAHNRHYHTRELPFVCEIENCNKKYASEKGLKYHQGKHSNTIFSCTECSKQYSHKNILQTHYKRHHSVGKIYYCEQCDKSFYDQYFLKKHMVCHTNDRPFLCDQCPANFPRQKALVAHKKIHSGVRDEVCKLCGQAFNLYEGLYQHMKIRHGIKYHRGMTLEDMLQQDRQNVAVTS